MDDRAPTTKRSELNARHCAWLASEQRPYLETIARRRGVAAGDVDDVIQDALVDVMRSFAGPDDDRFKIRAFAGRCVERRALKRWRRARRKEDQLRPMVSGATEDRAGTEVERGIEDERVIDPVDACLRAEELAEEREILRALEPKERAAILLRAAGFSTEEICERLNLSERSLRKRVTRANAAIARLRAKGRD